MAYWRLILWLNSPRIKWSDRKGGWKAREEEKTGFYCFQRFTLTVLSVVLTGKEPAEGKQLPRYTLEVRPASVLSLFALVDGCTPTFTEIIPCFRYLGFHKYTNFLDVERVCDHDSSPDSNFLFVFLAQQQPIIPRKNDNDDVKRTTTVVQASRGLSRQIVELVELTFVQI